MSLMHRSRWLVFRRQHKSVWFRNAYEDISWLQLIGISAVLLRYQNIDTNMNITAMLGNCYSRGCPVCLQVTCRMWQWWSLTWLTIIRCWGPSLSFSNRFNATEMHRWRQVLAIRIVSWLKLLNRGFTLSIFIAILLLVDQSIAMSSKEIRYGELSCMEVILSSRDLTSDLTARIRGTRKYREKL